MESFINNFLSSPLSHFYPGTVWTQCQFPESILHSPPSPPLLSSFPPPHSLCPSKQCPCRDNYTHPLPHTLTRCVYHWRAGGGKAISFWCECCISPSLPLSLSLIFIASHGFPSPADIWSHKRYICCYNHWHLLASGHRLCQCWLFLLGGGVNATGAAAAAAAQNQWLWARGVFRLQPNPGGSTRSALCLFATCAWPSWPSESHTSYLPLLSMPAKRGRILWPCLSWTEFWEGAPEIGGCVMV